MENLKLEVVKYLTDDVVATSSYCKKIGLKDESYELVVSCGYNEVCGWKLTNQGMTGGKDFTYYDENGNKIDTNLQNNGWINPSIDGTLHSNKWFHYSGGNYILCTASEHRHDN